ncbi:hypothetical protein HUT06_21345 [Actinomadura sp. NAK00032]|uniref:hypothetical protein n=1 Tax=Actinomadura sp. NAK00032 TaxID=2742128 RepID=UPI00158FB980|nr:hypothetical protein [Actinomadura sp. NAK00032]QKW36265.1 hypothetical protein HUT06_21345 [Actinomadura sp. NAK00032]
MTPIVLLDTCSIANFGVVHRLPLLMGVLAGQGRWTEAIAWETRKLELPMGSLPQLQAALGEPYIFDDLRDIDRIDTIRRALGGTSRKATEHLGEAQTIFAVAHVPELKGARVLTDDANAAQYARSQGIRTMSTHGVLRSAYQQNLLQCPQPFDILIEMQGRGRWVSVPSDHSGICPSRL